MRNGVPRDVVDEGYEALLNFLSHLAIADEVSNGLHPENLMGPTTVTASDYAAFSHRQEKAVAFMALLMDHLETDKMHLWIVEDAEIIFRDGNFDSDRKPHKEAIEDMKNTDYPRAGM